MNDVARYLVFDPTWSEPYVFAETVDMDAALTIFTTPIVRSREEIWRSGDAGLIRALQAWDQKDDRVARRAEEAMEREAVLSDEHGAVLREPGNGGLRQAANGGRRPEPIGRGISPRGETHPE